jgi:hypothetical protein
MRQLLSERTAARHAVPTAAGLSAVLLVAALADQLGARSLVDHATALYAPYDKHIDAGLLYGAVYGVAVIGLVLWLIALRAGKATAVVATVVTAALAVVLFTAGEYGGTIFPPVWGVLALLSPAAGVVAVVDLLRRR